MKLAHVPCVHDGGRRVADDSTIGKRAIVYLSTTRAPIEDMKKRTTYQLRHWRRPGPEGCSWRTLWKIIKMLLQKL